MDIHASPKEDGTLPRFNHSREKYCLYNI